ncbi:MAG: hypothetical protein KGJ02_04800 [Verrucomicrobiota bacterium]|nr:hypothetical protein [Verrucomicrobiota bacterium]
MFILFVFQLHSYSIVFIHLGNKIPDYLSIAVKQARLFNRECPIYLLHNKGARLPAGMGVIPIECESLSRSSFHQRFRQQTKLDKRSLNGFWFYTTERFYYLQEFIQQYNLIDVFHLENDVMLYANLNDLLPVFHTYYKGMIGATYEGEERCVPGFVYIADIHPMNELMAFLAGRVGLNETDMEWIGRFINYKHKIYIDTLPVLFPNYRITVGLRFCEVSDDRFSNYFEAFDSLFDAAAMGQYLGGESPVHNTPVPGYVNPVSAYVSSHFTFEWEVDSEGRRIPFILFQGQKKRINNLHIHSKNLQLFYSQ